MLDADARAIANSGVLHQWRGPPEEHRFRSIVYGSEKLIARHRPSMVVEMYVTYHFIVKNHSSLCSQKFTLIVVNQALSWFQNIVHRSCSDRSMDHGARIILLSSRRSHQNTASQGRWAVQKDQQLPMARKVARAAVTSG